MFPSIFPGVGVVERGSIPSDSARRLTAEDFLLLPSLQDMVSSAKNLKAIRKLDGSLFREIYATELVLEVVAGRNCGRKMCKDKRLHKVGTRYEAK
jgi:hypothetical protein